MEGWRRKSSRHLNGKSEKNNIFIYKCILLLRNAKQFTKSCSLPRDILSMHWSIHSHGTTRGKKKNEKNTPILFGFGFLICLEIRKQTSINKSWKIIIKEANKQDTRHNINFLLALELYKRRREVRRIVVYSFFSFVI